MAITPKKEKALREYNAPSRNYIINPIINLDSRYPAYNIDPTIIMYAMQHTFSGVEGQDPGLHLSEFDSYCDVCKPKGLTKEFVLLKIFNFSLAGRAKEWFKTLPHKSIMDWEELVKIFMFKFSPNSKRIEVVKEVMIFFPRSN